MWEQLQQSAKGRTWWDRHPLTVWALYWGEGWCRMWRWVVYPPESWWDRFEVPCRVWHEVMHAVLIWPVKLLRGGLLRYARYREGW